MLYHFTCQVRHNMLPCISKPVVFASSLLSSDFIFSRIVGSFPFSTMNPVPMKCIAIFMWSSGFPSQPGVRPSPHSHQLEGHAATIAPLGLWYLDSRSHQHRPRPHRKPTGNSINWRNQSINQSINQSNKQSQINQIKTNRMKIKIKMKSNRIESNQMKRINQHLRLLEAFGDVSHLCDWPWVPLLEKLQEHAAHAFLFWHFWAMLSLDDFGTEC